MIGDQIEKQTGEACMFCWGSTMNGKIASGYTISPGLRYDQASIINLTNSRAISEHYEKRK